MPNVRVLLLCLIVSASSALPALAQGIEYHGRYFADLRPINHRYEPMYDPNHPDEPGPHFIPISMLQAGIHPPKIYAHNGGGRYLGGHAGFSEGVRLANPDYPSLPGPAAAYVQQAAQVTEHNSGTCSDCRTHPLPMPAPTPAVAAQLTSYYTAVDDAKASKYQALSKSLDVQNKKLTKGLYAVSALAVGLFLLLIFSLIRRSPP